LDLVALVDSLIFKMWERWRLSKLVAVVVGEEDQLILTADF
jgi:hypothetical protein